MADDSISIGKDKLYLSVIVILIGLIILSILSGGFGIVGAKNEFKELKNNTTVILENKTNDIKDETVLELIQKNNQIEINKGNLPVLGSDSSAVYLVEFSDYQCPFCSRLYNDGFAGVKKNYVDSGKVKVYFRDFPLSFHPNALPAAIAARCANEQGKFWEMHNKLFETQSAWSGLSDASATFKGYATGMSLDSTKFNSCLDAKSYVSDISSDTKDGTAYGVQGTPGAFIIIPKNKISKSDLEQGLKLVGQQFGSPFPAAENNNEYIVFVPGAYPFASFDLVLSKINY